MTLPTRDAGPSVRRNVNRSYRAECGRSGRSDQMQQCINIRFAACLPSGSRDRLRCERALNNRTPTRLIG